MSPVAPEHPDLAADLGIRLRTARERAGVSMRALARSCGVSQPFLSLVEHGRSTPSLSTLYRIATALDVSPADLMPTDAPSPVSPGAPPVRHVPAGGGKRFRVSEAANAAEGVVIAATNGLEVVEYDIRAGQDLGGWFESPGTQNVMVIDGRIRIELEGLGAWTLSRGESLTHPAAIPHRWSVDADRGARLVLSIAR